MVINYSKHIWEGWTVQDFVDDLQSQFDTIMAGQSWIKPFATKDQIKQWCMDNQPYYKKHIPEVVNHFAKMAGIK